LIPPLGTIYFLTQFVETSGPSTKNYQPNRSSVSKEYHYYFAASLVDNVATSDIALHLPIENIEPDNLALLRSACQLFMGRHDFYNFSILGNRSGLIFKIVLSERDVVCPLYFNRLARVSM
jgi:tRNA U38,U39,U40 pseudouridine synthase TruA